MLSPTPNSYNLGKLKLSVPFSWPFGIAYTKTAHYSEAKAGEEKNLIQLASNSF